MGTALLGVGSNDWLCGPELTRPPSTVPLLGGLRQQFIGPLSKTILLAQSSCKKLIGFLRLMRSVESNCRFLALAESYGQAHETNFGIPD